jgi:hypothetical protein
MKFKKIWFGLMLFSQLSSGKCAITYEFNGGRFGDCLSTFAKAKWYAFKYKFQLLYKPFKYSDQLNLHTSETPYKADDLQFFNKIIKVKSETDIINNKDDNVLFISNFYSITPDLYEYRFIDKRWEREIQKAICPSDIPQKYLNKNAITIALHVRKGGGFDQPLSTDESNSNKLLTRKFADEIWPTKFPSDEYYIEGLASMIKLVEQNKIINVYLFTDDPEPAKLAAKYAAALSNPRVQFVYRDKDNTHDKNVVEDYFAMAECDYLIRSSSLLAKASQLLGNHQVILFPRHGYWDGNQAIIDLINIAMRK